MVLQRTRPPLLETPWEVFDIGVFTPNDQFYVRWHWAGIPTSIDVANFRLAVHGHVERPLSLTLVELLHGLPRVELAAVNQCSGNSRGFFTPRVPGAQWANGAMGNALWTGVPLKDVLDRAGVKAGAVQVRFHGVDEAVVPDAPRLMKSLAVDHARDGEVMVAYAMNGEQLPLLNGFPLRLVVPGWYSTYWVKMLNDIEVLDQPDTNYWMKTAYTIPDTPHASIHPGETGVKMLPINRLVPAPSSRTSTPARVCLTACLPSCAASRSAATVESPPSICRSIAAKPGLRLVLARMSRQLETPLTLPSAGRHTLMVRCTNSNGDVQPDSANWNPAGFTRNVIESLDVVAS